MGAIIYKIVAASIYCPELNGIETQWRQSKAQEISGRMFDNEYDLAMVAIASMKAPAEKEDDRIERFIFNPA